MRRALSILLGLALVASGCGQPPASSRGDVPANVAERLEMHGVTLDMSADEVVAKLGKPRRIDSERPPWAPRSRPYTRWTYPFDDAGHVAVRFVWLVEGRVAAIEATELDQDGRTLLSDRSTIGDVIPLLGVAQSTIPRSWLHYNLTPFTTLDISMTGDRVYRLQLQRLAARVQ